MDAAAHAIYTRLLRVRLARCLGGLMLILTALAMLVGAAVADISAHILLIGWGSSLLALPLSRLLTPTLEPRTTAERLATWSLRLPMLGLALLMPMTLHAMVAMLAGPLHLFSRWVVISTLVVSPAYVTLLWLLYQDAQHIVIDPTVEHWKQRAWSTVCQTTVAAGIPGIVLVLPPIITFITGAAFIPALYFFSYRIYSWERLCQDWLALASRVGLTITALHPDSLPSLTGIVDGVRIELHGWRTVTGGIVLELEAALGNPALLHLNISADPSDPAQIRLGDPVLDAVLRVSSSQSTSAAELAELLRDEDRYAALMRVTHGLGGRISRGRIHLQLQTASIAALWEALPQVIELSELMRESPAPIPLADAALSRRQPLHQASPAG